MRRDLRFVTAVLATAALLASCSHSSSTTQSTGQQETFGVQMAKINLWREAMFRFQRAVDIDPSSANAHNNLAVAFEANGDFEKARKEYLEALKLDKGNQYIQKNYSRFVEFTSRNKKRAPKTATTAPGSTPLAPTASTAPLPPAAGAPADKSGPPSTTPPPPDAPRPPHGGR